MKRELEPELMEDPAQVIAYAEADFEKPHNDFIERIKAIINPATFAGKALDLGCGPGDISRRFANAFPLCACDAIDGSKAMIAYAKKTTDTTLLSRLNFIQGTLPIQTLPHNSYAIIVSNSLLHHLHNPQVLWQTIKQYAKSGTIIAVMDLLRPESKEKANTLVTHYAGSEPTILQNDFYHSLLAAFTLDEINAQLSQAELPLQVEQVSDRHVFISGNLNLH